MASKVKNAGRPVKITDDVLQKLEFAFIKGLSDREACLYAGIAPSTLYNYCEKHKDFLERKELLKESPKMRAKINIAAGIEAGSIDISQYYLERKCPEEYSLKQRVQLDGELSVKRSSMDLSNYTDEELTQLEELLNKSIKQGSD